MGGVGKTQLATEFAYAHAADYDLVYWLAAEESAAMPDQFTALAASWAWTRCLIRTACGLRFTTGCGRCRAGC